MENIIEEYVTNMVPLDVWVKYHSPFDFNDNTISRSERFKKKLCERVRVAMTFNRIRLEQEVKLLLNLQKMYTDIGKMSLPRRKKAKYDPFKSAWAEYFWLEDFEEEELRNDQSPAAKKFRNRFRVPFALYHDVLLPFVKEHFPDKPDCTGEWLLP